MPEEFATGDYILYLEGRTMDIFRRTASESMRFHVDFLRVNGKQRGAGYRIRVGAGIGAEDITGGVSLDLTAEEYGPFREFIGRAIAARDQGLNA